MDSISGVVPFVVAALARSVGADPEALLQGSGVGAAAPPPGDEHIEIARYFEVRRQALELLDVTFPLRVASAFQLEDNEVFGISGQGWKIGPRPPESPGKPVKSCEIVVVS